MIQARKGAFTTSHIPLSDIAPLVAENLLYPFAAPLALWQSHIDAGGLPQKDSLRFTDFRGWHNKLVISKYGNERGLLHFQIVGEVVETLFGGAIERGKSFADAPVSLFPHYLEHFGTLQDGTHFGAGFGNVPFEGREFLRFFFIDLPAINSDGEVTHLYSFFHGEEKSRNLMPHWQTLLSHYPCQSPYGSELG